MLLLLLLLLGGREAEEGGRVVVARPFGLLLADALLDEVLGGADGVGRAADRHPAVARARRVDALLGDLNVGAAEVLDLQQRLAARTQNGADDVLAHLQLRPAPTPTAQSIRVRPGDRLIHDGCDAVYRVLSASFSTDFVDF